MLEFRKMRRLRVGFTLVAMVAVVVGLSGISLFSASSQKGFDDPAAAPWAGILVSYTMMSAMTSPIFMAVLASRQTDIEHSGGGWFLSQMAGVSPGRLLRAKFVALAVLTAGAVVAQTAGLVAMGLFAGIQVSLDVVPWVIYTALLILVDVAFLALNLWLAAVVENQLISVGIGLIGAFVATFMLLTPPSIARFLPWGYYAMISTITTDGRDLIHTTPPYLWIAGFLALAAACFVLATRRFDRIER